MNNILKYLQRTKDTFLIYGGFEEVLIVKYYTDASSQTYRVVSHNHDISLLSIGGSILEELQADCCCIVHYRV